MHCYHIIIMHTMQDTALFHARDIKYELEIWKICIWEGYGGKLHVLVEKLDKNQNKCKNIGIPTALWRPPGEVGFAPRVRFSVENVYKGYI